MRGSARKLAETIWGMGSGRTRVGYLGPPGTFSEQAARRYDPLARHVPFGDIESVVRAAEKEKIDEALVPLENSTEGPVTVTTDLLVHRTDLRIRREVVLPIHLCLLTEGGVDFDEIRVVYSHPQAIAQCRDYLARKLPKAEPVASLSTVRAVEDMRIDGPGAAAISSMRAAEVRHAFVREGRIEDVPGNRTRFAVLAQRDHEPTGKDKTSICFDFAGRRSGHPLPGARRVGEPADQHAEDRIAPREEQPRTVRLSHRFRGAPYRPLRSGSPGPNQGARVVLQDPRVLPQGTATRSPIAGRGKTPRQRRER